MSFWLKRRRHLLAIEPDLARRLHAAAEARGVNPETIANRGCVKCWEELARPFGGKAPLARRPDEPSSSLSWNEKTKSGRSEWDRIR